MLASICDLLKSVPALAAFIQVFYLQNCTDHRSNSFESSENETVS